MTNYIVSEFYSSDVDTRSFKAEYELFRHHSDFHACSSVIEVLKLLHSKQLVSAYPNIACLYRICNTIPVTTASTERSFSKLKLIKTALRSTMSEARLSYLLILSIERELANQVNYDAVIDAFANRNPRRLSLSS